MIFQYYLNVLKNPSESFNVLLFNSILYETHLSFSELLKANCTAFDIIAGPSTTAV